MLLKKKITGWIVLQCKIIITKYQNIAINSFSMKHEHAHEVVVNQRLPGACNRSPGSKLLSITTQLHCGGHLRGRA